MMHTSLLQTIHVTVATLHQLFAYPFLTLLLFYSSLTYCYTALFCSHLASYLSILYVYQNSKLQH